MPTDPTDLLTQECLGYLVPSDFSLQGAHCVEISNLVRHRRVGVQTGRRDLTVSFSVSGAFFGTVGREGEMATRLLPAQAPVSGGFFLELPSWLRGPDHNHA